MTTKLTDKNISNVSNLGIQWQAVIVADGSTATSVEAGKGYFIDTTSNAHTVTLPSSPNAGDTIAIKDYAGTFATNNLTISRNGHNIQGVANDSLISTNRANVELAYIDATKGWLYTNESNVADLQNKTYVTATGGTITTSGDFKIHAFTGDGCFVVSCAGNPAGSNSLSNVLVVAGGGGGGRADIGAGGGAGGLRNTACVAVSVQTYPITVGGGGAAQPSLAQGNNGSNSVFSTITSTGGGGGGGAAPPYGPEPGNPGGSGGGGANACGTGGTGNTPPVSPSQGNDGGPGATSNPTGGGGVGGGGGGATAVGGGGPSPDGGNGGAGLDVSPFFGAAPQPFYQANQTCRGATACGQFAGGGGGAGDGPGGSEGGVGGVGGGGKGSSPGNNSGYAGTTNSGGGGGGGENTRADGGAGGSGIVIIRYKFQN
ncbi:hypothetical protein N9J01_00340 [bacterium]|nr:hypothetical protein [bacterium]